MRILRRRIRERRWNRRGRMMAAAAKNRQQRRNQIRVKSNDGSEAGARRSEDMKKSSRRGREKRVARAGHLGNLACCVTPARAARSPDPTLCPHFERALGPSFPELRSRLCPGNSRAQSDLVSTSCASSQSLSRRHHTRLISPGTPWRTPPKLCCRIRTMQHYSQHYPCLAVFSLNFLF